jgi:hypothetical protein
MVTQSNHTKQSWRLHFTATGAKLAAAPDCRKRGRVGAVRGAVFSALAK